MTEAICTVVAVLAAGAALQPRPRSRRPLEPVGELRRRRPLPTVRRRHRTNQVRPDEVAAWCESLARVIRSGSTMSEALRCTVPPSSCSVVVDQVVLSIDRGVRVTSALAVDGRSPHLDLAIGVLRACAANGGPPAEPLDRAAATLRGRATDLADRQTYSAQARLSAVVMTLLPIGMLALLIATSPTTRDAAGTPLGGTAVIVGALLNLGGWHWMRHIIDGAAT